MSLLPPAPCMNCDLAEHLVDNTERSDDQKPTNRLYEGFDSKWLKKVFYHNISSDSAYYFLKAEWTPSLNIHQ